MNLLRIAQPTLLVGLWLAEPQSIPPSFQSTDFKQVDRVASLPLPLRQALESAIHGTKMANPNEPFEATDVILDASVPQRRLIFAGVSPHMSLVYYEHGGIGLHEHLLIFSGDERDGYRLVANLSMVEKRPRDVANLKALVAKRKPSGAAKGDA